MNGPQAALALCRFFHDAAAMLLWGAFGYLVLLVPRQVRENVGHSLARLRFWAVGFVGLTTTAALFIETAAIGNGWADAADPTMVKSVLLDTSVGQAWHWQCFAALLLAASQAVPSRYKQQATAASAGLMLASIALSGHSAMHEGWLGFSHRLNHAGHLLAAGAWIGALVPLRYILPLLEQDRYRSEAAVALRKFSAAGHWAVALVIGTGSLNTVLVLGRWPTNWASPYQALLATKIAVVLVMVTLAVANRYILVPSLGRHHDAAFRAIRLITLAEVGLGLVAIGLVSFFGLLEPV